MVKIKDKILLRIVNFQWIVPAILIVLSIFLGYMTSKFSMKFIMSLVGLLFLGIMISSVKMYKILLLLYIFVFVATFDYFGYNPVLSLPINLYLSDGILIFLVGLLIHLLLQRIPFSNFQSPVTKLLVANFIFGCFAVLLGFMAGHTSRNILGDFRRFFIYPLVSLITITIPLNRSDLKSFFKIFIIAILILSLGAFGRIVSGETWDPEQFNRYGEFRALGYFSGILVLMGISIILSFSKYRNGLGKFLLLILFILLEAILFLSGYRLLWVSGVFIPFFINFFSSKGILKAKRIIMVAVVIMVILLMFSLITQLINPKIYQYMVDRYKSMIGFDFSNDIRYFSWRAAWKKFLTSPFLGIGIGDQFEFVAINSQGNYYISNLTTHNIFLSLLYQTGIVGIILFLVIHVTFFVYSWRQIKKKNSNERIILIGMIGVYIITLLIASFQPLLNSPGPIIIFYLWMGLILNISRSKLNRGLVND